MDITARPPATAGLSVLVIDDEDYVADMVATVLNLEGYKVHVAYNGRDGLATAQHITVDLMIIDIMMPYLSGPALVEKLRISHHTRDTPIILISAGAQPVRKEKVAFLAKPFDMDVLLDLVATTIGHPPADDQL